MRCAALLVALGAICAFSATPFAQSAAALSASAPAKATSAARSKPASPIQTQFKAFKVYFLANGQEELEVASSVSPGDVVEYVAVHRNASQQRLLNVDFAIPIPWGTTLWERSVQPSSGKLVQAAKDATPQDRARVVWRVARLDPGQSVDLKLRVSIDPDPTLTPAKPANPFAPRVPQLRHP